MKKIYTLIAIVLFSSICETYAQRSNQRRRFNRRTSSAFKGEIGGNIGVSNFQGDFTPKGAGDGLIAINGISVNATYTIHAMQNRRSLHKSIKNHLMLKLNAGFTSANFDNLGNSTGREDLNDIQTNNNVLLGRLKSKSSVLSFGGQVEYYFKDLFNYFHRSRRRRRSRRGTKGNPYVGIGMGINYVKSTPEYDPQAILRSVGDNGGLPDRYTPEVIAGINSVILSGNAAVGYRYKLNRQIDLVGELKINYYFSDRIDAVDTDVNGIDNKFNDYNSVISIGAIYHLF